MMGLFSIKMPDIGEGIAEVELVEWHVAPGDSVVEDQTLADVMTDKATVEIPSPVKGRVLALGGQVGQVLAVGTELIRLEVEGAGNVAADATDEPPQRATPPAAPGSVPAAASTATTPAEPPPRRTAGERPIASPAVRRRAWDLGIELRYVPGSGPAGRITHADLDAFAARGPQSAATAARPVERHGEDAVPVIGLRRRIAQKMQDSKRRIPHFTYVEEVDVTELEALRARLIADLDAVVASDPLLRGDAA
jgi:2-oxoisovalerate dehydrogenase E2 component (dihydrolipoyl transacylase)